MRHRDSHEYKDGSIGTCSVNENKSVLIALMKKFQLNYPCQFSPAAAVWTGCGGARDALQIAKLKAMKMANTLEFILVLFSSKFTA